MRHFFTSYSFHDSFFFFFLRLEVFFLECGYGGCFIHGDDKIASHSFIITATAAKEAFLRAQPSQPDVQDAYIYIYTSAAYGIMVVASFSSYISYV
jgi:hypothetical protein